MNKYKIIFIILLLSAFSFYIGLTCNYFDKDQTNYKEDRIIKEKEIQELENDMEDQNKILDDSIIEHSDSVTELSEIQKLIKQYRNKLNKTD